MTGTGGTGDTGGASGGEGPGPVRAGHVPGLRYVGIGVSRYNSDDLDDLARPARDVGRIGRVLATAPPRIERAYTPTVLANPTAREVEELIEGSALASGAAGVAPAPTDLMVVWSGHGEPAEDGRLVLAVRDTERGEDGIWDPAVVAERLVTWAATSGARQLLMVFDCCSAASAQSAVAVADAVENAVKRAEGAGDFLWIGLLTAAVERRTATQGLLTHHLRKVLEKGPRDGSPHIRNWTAGQPFVGADDVIDELFGLWPTAVGATSAQLPEFTRNPQRPGMRHRRGAYGTTGPEEDAGGGGRPVVVHPYGMFRNPRYVPGTGPQVVQHLLEAAHGTGDVTGPSMFSGRRAEVDLVVSRIARGEPGVWTLTGPPGSGKSAVIGRVVTLSDPDRRALLLGSSVAPDHADPGPGSVHAHVHARGRTADGLAGLIDGQLIGAGVLTARDDMMPRDAEGLVTAVREARHGRDRAGSPQALPASAAQPVVLVLDGLDEARSFRTLGNMRRRRDAFDIVERLVVPLAESAVVLVATRDLPDDGDEGRGLLARLCGDRDADLDLGAPEFRESGADAVRAYVARRLTGAVARSGGAAFGAEEAGRVAEHVLGSARDDGAGAFLLARLLTDLLVSRPTTVDTSRPDWTDRLGGSVGEAVRRDLDTVPAPPRAALAERATEHARTLLTALTWGLGAGFPEAEWLVVATALARADGLLDGATDRYEGQDVGWVLSSLGRYVIQDVFGSADGDGTGTGGPSGPFGGAPGPATYRIAHQSVADVLRPPFTPTVDTPFDADAVGVANAVLAAVRDWYDSGLPLVKAPYLWRHHGDHAAAAGQDGLNGLADLTERTEDFRQLVDSARSVARRIVDHGYARQALPSLETALTVARGLVKDDLADELDFLDVGVLAETLEQAAQMRFLMGETELAYAHAVEAREAYERLVDEDYDLSLALPALVEALLREAETQPTDTDGVRATLHRALELTRRRPAAHLKPYVCLKQAGVEHLAGHPRAALAALEAFVAAAGLEQPMSGTQDPGSVPDVVLDAGLLPRLGDAGVLFAALDRLDLADRMTTIAVASLRDAFAEAPERVRRLLADTLRNRSEILRQRGLIREAVASAEEARALLSVHDEPGPLAWPEAMARALVEVQLTAVRMEERSFALAYLHATEAVTRLRLPARSRPDAARILATALLNLSGVLLAQVSAVTSEGTEQRERIRGEAYDHAAEAMDLLDGLRAQEPERYGAAWSTGTAAFLTAVDESGRSALAIDRIERVLGVMRERFADSAEFGRLPLVRVLMGVAQVVEPEIGVAVGPAERLPGLERTAECLDEALALLRPLVLQDPDAHADEMSSLLRELARVLRRIEHAASGPAGAGATGDGAAPGGRRVAGPAASLPDRADALESEALELLREGHARRPKAFAPDLAFLLKQQAGRAPEAEAVVLLSEALDVLLGVSDPLDHETAQDTVAVATALVVALTGLEREDDVRTVWRRLEDAAHPMTSLVGEVGGYAPESTEDYLRVLAGLLAAPDAVGARRNQLRQELRNLREDLGDAFDGHWRTAVGTDPPDWLTVPVSFAELLTRWFLQTSLDGHHTFLVDHPEMLTDDAERAVEELWEAASPTERTARPITLQTLRGLLGLARTYGVGAVREEAVRNRITAFCTGDAAGQIRSVADDGAFLRELAPELFAPEPDLWLFDPPLASAWSVLSLSQDEAGNRMLDRIAGALEDPSALTGLLRSMLGTDTGRAAGAASVVGHAVGEHEPRLAEALLVSVLARLDRLASEVGAVPEEALREVSEPVSQIADLLGSDPELGSVWREELAAFAERRPESAPLVEVWERAVGGER
ncbi:hypothetical protein ACIA8H_35910 [Streptomyces goshikiensis]|uniref:hypothetical protein n=1 Tax=Streptomyces goshikiensis TaxID=1942 RepID=UPI0037B06823